MEYIHLMLPMEFEPERRCETSIGFADPRKNDGDLLDPVRFSRETVENLKRDMGSHAFAGQYQQRPTAREGGLFKRHWFEGRIVNAVPEGTVWVRHWDLASTKKGQGARTAGVKIGRSRDGRFYVAHSVTVREEGLAVRSLIKTTAEIDGYAVRISLPQDPGQAGKSQAQDMVAMLAGYTVTAEPETGDKVTRAEPFAVQCEAGNVYLVQGEWNQGYLDEICAFPGASLKDQVDASSGAFARLANTRGPMQISSIAVQRAQQGGRR
jgi:predicted phage terminase large subunit-like protein